MPSWWVAAALCFGAAVFHASQRERILAPLAEGPRSSRWLCGLCWDVVTLLFAAMAAGLGLAASKSATTDVALYVAGLAFGVAVLSARSALRERMSPLKHPAVIVMTGVAFLALIGG